MGQRLAERRRCLLMDPRVERRVIKDEEEGIRGGDERISEEYSSV